VAAAKPNPEVPETLPERLEVELDCTECGAAFVAGIWDHSFRCSYCGSVLACERALGDEVFAVSDGGTAAAALEILIRNECESYRNELIGRSKNEEGQGIDLAPPLLDLQVSLFRKKLERDLALVEAHDFLVPYELHQRTVVQGVLGRRGAAKESIFQSIRTEDVGRRYDAARYNLRDRGLKIRGARLALLSAKHLERAGGRALAVAERGEGGPEAPGDRSRVQLDPTVEAIGRLDGIAAERRVRVWKQMGFARVTRGGQVEDYLIDRQFGTIAGCLESDESASYRELAPRPLDEVLQKPVLRAIAAECPNCGGELQLSPRAHLAFCPTCATAIRISADGLSPVEYLRSEVPERDGAEAVLGFPFWAFPLQLLAGDRVFQRVWDWLEVVGPQTTAQRFRETDPATSLLYVPARATFGSRPLDDAFAALVSVATWRQPSLLRDRPTPAEGLSLLDVELDAAEAAAFAHFALVALHDPQSTRRLNGVTFRQLVGDAELVLGHPELAVVALPIHAGHWHPDGPAAQKDLRNAALFPKPVARALLEDPGAQPRRTKTFSLP
jgi:predicted RNA-binding Zn-ribbon protein involved in translation (DUF1610 family)